MKLLKTIKNTGKFFIDLKQENEDLIEPSILLIDSWAGYPDSCIKKLKDIFPASRISILTFKERKSVLEKSFSGINFILHSDKSGMKKYQTALEMLKMRRKRWDFVVLFSLDIMPLTASLIFFRSRTVLYNRWGQWWSLKMRDVTEIFKAAYSKKSARFSLINFLRKIGLFFVLLERKDEGSLRQSVIIVDNGRTPFEHVYVAIEKIKKRLPIASISLLSSEKRDVLKKDFPDIEIINLSSKKYGIIRHMLRRIRNKRDWVVLLSLDIWPITAAILFMRTRLILYNKWHQWWTLSLKPIRFYLMIIPRFILNILIFIYLLLSVSWIFTKRSFNLPALRKRA